MRWNESGLRPSDPGLLYCLLMLLLATVACAAEAPHAATAGFDRYRTVVEQRLARQHRSMDHFLAPAGDDAAMAERRMRAGEPVVDRVSAEAGSDLPGALLHHWRGTAFVAGARAADFERQLRDVDAYPERFRPEVVQAKVLAGAGDHMQVRMRVRQRHVITVVMDATYDITFGRLDGRHGYSTSRSTQIAEIDGAGTGAERALSTEEEHGFLWRQNTYWSFEERDSGLYLQIESVSLSRSIPRGAGWVVRPYVESIPRESMEFTLRSACAALRSNR